MRTKTGLKDLNDVSTVYKYLYLSENNKITYNNGLTDLTIRMNDNYDILCKNESFPEIPETNFNEMFSVSYVLGMIEILKNQPATEHPSIFENRWEEIKTLTSADLALNLSNKENSRGTYIER